MYLPGPLAIALLLALVLVSSAYGATNVYQTRDQFLTKAFGEQIPGQDALWMSDELQAGATSILSHPYNQLRVRYWLENGRSAWILEEVGKVRPITIGVVVESGVIVGLGVMVYRESRGGEVRFPFFTQQFQGLALISDSPDYELEGGIDGITGATLSVRAMTRIARLALYFHKNVVDLDL